MISGKRPELDKNITKELTPEVLKYIYKVYDQEKIPKLINSVVKFEKGLSNQDPRFVNKPRKVFLHRIAKLKTDRDRLEAIIDYYIFQIDGKFVHWLFKILNKIAGFGLTLILYPLSCWNFLKALFFYGKMLTKKIKMDGDFDYIKKLEKEGTLVFVPNHTSNYDSLFLSDRLNFLGISPPMWGAGLNLYSNPVSKFVMNNVGCYKVDRRNKTSLYLEVLKQYSRFYLGKSFNTIFYPGGTRSRSGAIEQKLKLGLLGTVTDAFIEKKDKYFIIPVIITYTAVPEALNLAYDYFYGKVNRKKILKKEKAKRSFWQKIKHIIYKSNIDNNIHLKFGDVLTPDGSLLADGYPSPKKGATIYDRSYNKELTASLGKSIAQQYKKFNSFSKVNVFCKAVLESYMANVSNKNQDKSDLVKDMQNAKLNYADIINAINAILSKQTANNHLTKDMKAIDIFRYSLDIIKPYVCWDGKKIIILTPELVFYYANKLNFL